MSELERIIYCSLVIFREKRKQLRDERGRPVEEGLRCCARGMERRSFLKKQQSRRRMAEQLKVVGNLANNGAINRRLRWAVAVHSLGRADDMED